MQTDVSNKFYLKKTPGWKKNSFSYILLTLNVKLFQKNQGAIESNMCVILQWRLPFIERELK